MQKPIMVKVKYVGPKERKYDTVAHTPTIWTQEEPVQEVEESVAELLIKHEGVWELATEAKAEAPKKEAVVEEKPKAAPKKKSVKDDDEAGE